MSGHKEPLMVFNILVCLLFVTALFFAAGESARGDSIMPENKVPGAEPISDPFTEALIADLTASGFQVSERLPDKVRRKIHAYINIA